MNLKGFFLIIELITVIVILITVANNVYLVENKIEIPGKVCEIFYKNKSQFYTKINGEMYPKFIPIYENVSINFECLNSIGSLKPKTILFWNKFNGLPFIPDLEKIIRSKNLVTNNVLENFNCPVNTCDVSFDRSKLQQSQMILFHLRNNIDEFPKIRHVNQHWVNRLLLNEYI